jgi:restriction system protein
MVISWAIKQFAKGVDTGKALLSPPLAKINGYVTRKNRDIKVRIPEAIENFSSSRRDPEESALRHYNPQPFEIPELIEYQYREIFEGHQIEPVHSTNSVNIASLSELLGFDGSLSYQPVLDLAKRSRPTYPEPQLVYPPAISSPPAWTPWVADETAIHFEPPYYTGWRSILNGLVRTAHKSEMNRCERALVNQEEMRKVYSARNEHLAKLQIAAKSAFDNVKELSDRSWKQYQILETERRGRFYAAFDDEQSDILATVEKLNEKGVSGLLTRVEWALRMLPLPEFISRSGVTTYDPVSRILIHEHQFPDLARLDFYKRVGLKSGISKKAATQKEVKEAAGKVHPSLSIRLAAEILNVDSENLVAAIVVNGWSDYTVKSTGQTKRAYCSSMFATRDQIQALNLSALDPVAAFSMLKGVVAKTLEVTPISPIMRLDTNDPRFVDAKEVLGRLSEGKNLAAMEWEDFEHLCRELFERAFAGSGAEVKVTQASRDQGVDAIIFDPDPIRGGKIVVQAKRYTNVVDVSAVRDLYGSLMNEGAIKGILVTTSSYGPDSYGFAKDKPITLLNGAELLGLLEKYGYKFRIDLEEARRLNQRNV